MHATRIEENGGEGMRKNIRIKKSGAYEGLPERLIRIVLVPDNM